MAEPDDDIQDWFDGLSFKLKKELAVKIKAEADGLAAAIKDAAPVLTGALRDSVQVRRKRNSLDFEVTAGGDATTKQYGRSTGYAQEVTIGQGNNRDIARQSGGDGVGYDYALATEYGSSKEAAEPFFYPTFRARQDDIRQNIEDAVADVISRS